VSFCTPEAFVAMAHDHGVPAIPGALTPGEVAACERAGADAVKLFPASLLSPAYVHELRAVMPKVRVVVTGGLKADPASLQPWLSAGVLATGVGGSLGTVATVGAAEVQRRAQLALAARAPAADQPTVVGVRTAVRGE
jgi:2-dehydro-3-deoxyphosphogluconate aldolase/(4S)-4-hydroxy-2-oxoglutarate aldolase